MASRLSTEDERRLCRFLLFPQNKEHTCEVSVDHSIQEIKRTLLHVFAPFFSRAVDNVNELRLVHCGVELSDYQCLREVTRDSASYSSMAIHVVLRPPASSSPRIAPEQLRNGISSGPMSEGEIEPGTSPVAGLSRGNLFSLGVVDPRGNEFGSAIAQAITMNPARVLDYENGSGTSDSDFLNGYSESDVQDYFAEWESAIHFHGAFFDEEESTMVEQAFRKHEIQEQSSDGRISFASVHKFLWMYFNWTQRNGLRPQGAEWPSKTVKHLARRVLSVPRGMKLRECTVSLLELRELFFLFDNTAEDNVECPHGERERVRVATQQLHAQLLGEIIPFDEQAFEEAFGRCDQDSRGKLSCQKVELLYFLYCVFATNRQRHDRGDDGAIHPNDMRRVLLAQERERSGLAALTHLAAAQRGGKNAK